MHIAWFVTQSVHVVYSACASIRMSAAICAMCAMCTMCTMCAAIVCLSCLITTRRRKRWATEDHMRILQVAEEHAKRDKLWYAEFGHQPPPTYDISTSPRFDAVTDSATWLEFLDRNGYAVIKGVANKREVRKAHDLLWLFLEEQTSMRRTDPESWTNAAFEAIGEAKTGICQGLNVGHLKLCWFLRCLPHVRRSSSPSGRRTSSLSHLTASTSFARPPNKFAGALAATGGMSTKGASRRVGMPSKASSLSLTRPLPPEGFA